MTTTTDVLVIGAGPTGLTMANILLRYGIRVRILDKKAGITEESRALVVHAKTLELLGKLGLAQQAIEEGYTLDTIGLLRNGKNAGAFTFLTDNKAGRTPYPFALMYGQNQTEQLLEQSLVESGGEIEWGAVLLDLTQTDSGVRATIQRSDGTEEIIEAGWIVGADGAHSPVRHALSLGFEGETYDQTLFLADVDLEWNLRYGQAYMDLTPTGFFAFFPMDGHQRYRLVGDLPSALAQKEVLTHDDVQSVLDAASGLQMKIVKTRWASVYRTHHRMTEHFRVGRVFLVGDAAHIHSPAGGQGMNTGIGDAYNLAWKLALVVRGAAHDTLLDSYEAERIPFARSILHGSDWGFQFQSTKNLVAQQFKLRAIPLIFSLLSHQPVLKRRAFWLLSQLWTTYRGSPAVAESGSQKKGPHAGDRAPYGFFEAGPDAGTSLFSKLENLDHHLLLFWGRGPQSEQQEMQVQSLLHAYKLPIHLHTIASENKSLHEIYDVNEPGLFLIRPDGHIAYRSSLENIAGLRSYLDSLFESQPSEMRLSK
ncbi:FAD-dependent monooxygenase [Tengunoibacter tsumagoiensis]|uniref:FAD-binding domain-containing protein n=1 Tax=Tengunoibacter tsumagoiensis TaxID=2014871 RepID=A0A402A6S1_9CHLR|nr:FAD-dependent monooxygenase [Tengunoibacter tsumagoiensis]GCE14832.1 hypothetical protein KTT_46910 [Tengunoibacter tsumagoiensis]